MQAAICTKYGAPDVVQIREVPTPNPKPDEVLIRTLATTVTSADWRIRALAAPRGFRFILRLVFGFNGPRSQILGSELVGEIASVGEAVTQFRVGDQVIAFAGVRMRCHAEFCTLRETAAVIKRPPGLTDAEAAALCFGGTTALHFLRDVARLQPGQRLLILGASGAVGTAAIQIARHMGAEVTGVSSAPNHDLLRRLGAQHVLDYKTQDFSTAADRYDVILDAVDATTYAKAKRALVPKGKFLMVAADLPAMLRAIGTLFTQQKALSAVSPERREDIQFLADLAAKGAYRPVIDSTFPLAKIQEAHARVESGRKRGSVVIIMK